MQIPRHYSLILVAVCLSLWVVSCGSKEKADTVDTVPCVKSLTIVKDDPLCISVLAFEDSGDVYIKKLNEPKVLLASVDVRTGDTFVVHKGRASYDFTLEGMQNGMLKFAVAIVENGAVPENRVQLVKPYSSRE